MSYLPPLTAESVAKEVDFILAKGWVPCLEFDKVISTTSMALWQISNR